MEKKNITKCETAIIRDSHLCSKGHVPNEETAKVLRELDSGKGWNNRKSLDDFWQLLSYKKYS